MIGVLVFPDFQLLDAAGPISVFEIGARFADNAPSIRVVAVTPGPVRSSSGVEMMARGLKPSGAITTLIVAGGEGVRQAATCEKTLGFVRTLAKRGVRIASDRSMPADIPADVQTSPSRTKMRSGSSLTCG